MCKCLITQSHLQMGIVSHSHAINFSIGKPTQAHTYIHIYIYKYKAFCSGSIKYNYILSRGHGCFVFAWPKHGRLIIYILYFIQAHNASNGVFLNLSATCIIYTHVIYLLYSIKLRRYLWTRSCRCKK
jgi:hypothetical protein